MNSYSWYDLEYLGVRMQLVKALRTCHIFAQSYVFLISMHAGITMNNVCLGENN